ncbi:hypothetical protein HDC92_002323 [Pedobacter sp. AK017]|uniref:hypothetical protein n=1 Tax=Pedobacter sp. AK017 TaxID=2723073 RepID=UPI00161EAF08|nr:hypothetical protein [Pedobacter sp. AK017]MBB5438642.1 hypothetical protein [Pedobacter sp. AK017]
MDINNFGPFDSKVWGTFFDCTMVVVTSFTLIYLIKTFKAQSSSLSIQQKTLESQLAVQKAQQLATEIEQRRFESEIRPDVKIEASFMTDKINITLTPINRALRYLTYKISQVSAGITDCSNIVNQPPSTYVLNSKINLGYLWDRKIEDPLLFSIDLTFQDEMDNKYELKIGVGKDGSVLKMGPRKAKTI